ncbi:MAG: hypothetical protein FWE05_11885 [Defluviitaleaceae bacterium]|nr:hypothetical protein [Defluviitaleaceae bacterium]
MSSIIKVEIGQKVFMEYVGFGQPKSKDKIIEGVITKVGRIYYTVEVNYSEYRFYKDNMMQESGFPSGYMLHLTEQDLLDRQEMKQLMTGVRNALKNNNLTLDQLRRVMKILK